MNIMLIVSVALGVLLIIGFLLGFLRSWKKSTIRFGLLIISFLFSLLLSDKLASLLMSRYVDGLVVTIFGQTFDFESIVGDIAGDLLGEGSALTNLATAILNIVIKLVAFLMIFIVMFVVTLIIYYFIAAILSSRQKKKSVGDAKPKWWERLIGGGVGIVGSLLVCMALFTPVFGVMNVCDKFLENEPSNASAYAYVENGLVCGKFYTEDKNIGKVESYLEKYDKLSKEYNSSFAGIVFKCTGVDKLGKTTFNRLSTVSHNGMKVNFTTECVNIVNVYNIYKTNFIKSKFDLSTEQSVEAVQSIYNIAKNSEVMQDILLDLMPKMAKKWSSGEKFLGMELPVNGDLKEIVVELLSVFDTADFEVIDRNINVSLNAIRVANKHNIIADVNGGAELMDVIDKDNFVKDELMNLSSTPEMKRVLPNIMTTTIKLAYKSVIDTEPSSPLDQTFTQEQISSIAWDDESTKMQTIVTKMFEFFDSQEVINNLTNFGIVIDNARMSKVISKPVQILMYDYINLKVTGIDSAKNVLLEAISQKWSSESYSYTSLFATVETTAKVAKDLESMEMTDMTSSLEQVLNNSDVKKTVQDAINGGVLTELVGDNKKASVYEDIVNGVLNSDEELNVSKEMEAGQVIADIINKSSNEEGNKSSMFEGTTQEEKNLEAKNSVKTLSESNAVMETISDDTMNTEVKEYINSMNAEDKLAFQNAIGELGDDNPNKNALKGLFGVA